MSQPTIPILHTSPDIIAIDKPAGLVVHNDGKTDERSLVDWILEHYPDTKDVGEKFPGIVHRLDRDTSGVMLIALTQAGFNHLKAQFQDRSIEKKYHAFVYGIMKENDGVIDRPIARSRKDFRLWSAQRGGRGEARDAVTHYKVLKRLETESLATNTTFIEVSPKTGRTHQIRVHMKAINHPIVADPLYAPKRESLLGFKRQALHAREIAFEDLEGTRVAVSAPYPEDFEFALSQIV